MRNLGYVLVAATMFCILGCGKSERVTKPENPAPPPGAEKLKTIGSDGSGGGGASTKIN